MESFPQIYEFHVILSNGKRINKSIKHIQWIHRHIIQYGLVSIHKIIFKFVRSTISPYGNHTITLQYQTSLNKYCIIYYHYYDWLNQLYTISRIQQYNDLCALYKLIATTDNLNISLLPHIDI